MTKPLRVLLLACLSLCAYWLPSQVAMGQNQAALELPLKNPRVHIDKSQRRLTLYDGKKILRVYKIGLGFQPQGAKQKQGDGKTPEGSYWIVAKNPQSRFYLSLALNYPNEADAKGGLASGLIDQKQYKRIRKAAKNQGLPPWDTALGGEIFIHGHGASSDWTLGCVALDDTAMKELYEALPVGTPVNIEP